MGKCKIIKTGIHTTVQDGGRIGFGYYAIPRSGAINKLSANRANNLVGNPSNSALLECNLCGPVLHFQSSAIIGVCGADMNWTLNGSLINLNEQISISKGDVLSSTYAKNGLRSYLAIQGSIESEKHFGSASVYQPAKLGFNGGQSLHKGGILSWTEVKALDSISKEWNMDQPRSITIKAGPEYELLSPDSKVLLTQTNYMLSPDSNRMGARLIGKELQLNKPIKHSVPVLPGFIQLTTGGQLIVLLQDGQTTGGYPRVAYLAEDQLNKINLLNTKEAFQFQWAKTK